MSKLCVTYTDPQGVFQKYLQNVTDNLDQLTFLHWYPNKMLDSPTLYRTVQSVKLNLVSEPDFEYKQHQIPGIYSGPIVQLMVLESTSLDIFKNKFRQVSRDWFQKFKKLSEPTGFLVVLTYVDKFNKHIYTRLVQEFGQENCVLLNLTEKPDWVNFKQLLQRVIIDTFSTRVDVLCSEIKKLESMRDVPGWNFGSLFAAYESLAWNLEYLNMFNDALSVYKKLKQFVNNLDVEVWSNDIKTSNWGVIGPRDCLVELVLSQTASLFDVRRHILAREISIWMDIARGKPRGVSDKIVEEFLGDALLVIPNLGEELPVPKRFIWISKVCKELFSLVSGYNMVYNLCGAILLLERDAMQALCALRGWKIGGVYNDITDDAPHDDVDDDVDDALERTGLSTEGEYESEFIRITMECIDYFNRAGYKRSVNKLTNQMVSVLYYKNDIEKAWKLTESLDYVPNEMLQIALDLAERLKLNEQILELSWRVLKWEKFNIDVKLLRSAAQDIKRLASFKDLEHDLSFGYSFCLGEYLQADGGGYFITLELKPKQRFRDIELLFDSIEVKASRTTFASTPRDTPRDTELGLADKTQDTAHAPVAPLTTYKLYTPTFIEGEMELESLVLKLGKQVFKQKLESSVTMKPLTTAFNASLEVSKKHNINERMLQIILNSPKLVENAEIKFEFVEVGGGTEPFSREVSIKDFNNTVLEVPVAIDVNFPFQRVDVSIKYDNDHYFVFQRTLDFQLLVSVDFQEYYRKNWMYYQFLVQPISMVPLQFVNAEVKSLENHHWGAMGKNGEMTGFKGSPISYLFQLPNDHPECLLTLSYRSLIAECQCVLYHVVWQEIEQSCLSVYKLLINAVCHELSMEVNISKYAVHKIIEIDELVIDDVVDEQLGGIEPKDLESLRTIIKDQLRNGIGESGILCDFSSVTSEVEINIPKPDIEFVHHVSLSLHHHKSSETNDAHLVGKPIKVKLEIETRQLSNATCELVYEVDRLAEGWSYTGKTKGKFNTSERVIEYLCLIPNRSGELCLPKINVYNPTVERFDSQVVVTDYVNTRILAVPEKNMLAITF